jgi:hypothetical protein
MSNTLEITPLNEWKTFAIPDKAFQRYKDWKYRRPTSETLFWGNSIIEWIEGCTFIKFSNKQERDKTISDFPKATAINEKIYKNWRNVPELVWSFEDGNEFYIIVSPTHNDTDEINPNIGVYKWMIINPELYFSDETQEQVKDWVEKTKVILDWE